MEFIIISGMSGAGKSSAAAFLEDLGFYCVDNMPVALITSFAGLCMAGAGTGKYSRVALVTDIRGGQTFDELNFDFEGLTGDDALAIEDELQAIGKPTISPTFSGQFLVRMAARACTNTIIDASGHPRRIGDDALRALPIFEFNRVRGKARSFLLASEL